MTGYDSFCQSPPSLGNQFEDDETLRSLLRRRLPAEIRDEVESELREMGRLAGAEFYPLTLRDRLNEPKLTQWDAWGRRVDRIDLTEVWQRAEKVAATHGVVATAYERRHGRYSRYHQFSLAYLFGPSTDIYSCPLALSLIHI